MRYTDWPGTPSLHELITSEVATALAAYPRYWRVTEPVAGTNAGISVSIEATQVRDAPLGFNCHELRTVLRADGSELVVTFVYLDDPEPRPEFDTVSAAIANLYMRGILCNQ